MQEHTYQNDDQDSVRNNQVSKLREDLEMLRKKAKNAKDREKRAKSLCKTLLQQLSEKDLINSELEHQLQSYRGTYILDCTVRFEGQHKIWCIHV